MPPPVYVAANLVAQHQSPPLSEDVYVTLKVSDNLHAALMPYLGRFTSRTQKRFSESRICSRTRAPFCRGPRSEGGVAAGWPRHLCVLHATLYGESLGMGFRESVVLLVQRGLPVMGVDGTLFNIQNGVAAAGHVRAKTGTWGSVNLLDDGELVTKGRPGTSDAPWAAYCLRVLHQPDGRQGKCRLQPGRRSLRRSNTGRDGLGRLNAL